MLQGRKRGDGACNYDHNTAKRKENKAYSNNGVLYKPNIYSISNWDSKDAANLFGFNYDEAENVIDGLKYIIVLLTGDFTDWKRGIEKLVTHSEVKIAQYGKRVKLIWYG